MYVINASKGALCSRDTDTMISISESPHGLETKPLTQACKLFKKPVIWLCGQLQAETVEEIPDQHLGVRIMYWLALQHKASVR